MNVNSTSSYVNNASSNKGFSGMISGMDTESMVEQMLSGTQSKIDKQEGLKQQIEWKQEIYRDIISQINAFQNQFFSTNSSSNLLSQTFFNAMNAITSSSAFKVTATSSAAAGNTKLEVRRLATNTSLTSGAGVSGKLYGQLDAQALTDLAKSQLDGDYTVRFKAGDKTVEADLREVFVDGNGFKAFANTEERDAAIQAKLQEAFTGTSVSVSVDSGKVTLLAGNAADGVSVSVDSGAQALQRLGLQAGASSGIDRNGNPTPLTGKINEIPALAFSITLDDLQKTISIDLRDVMDANGDVDLTRFKESMQKGLDRAHGTNQIQLVEANGKFELQVAAGRKVMISGETDVLNALGVKNGQSNRIGMGGTLKDLYFANGLQGSRFKFTINGEEFSFTEDDTISDIITAINRSNAGVRLVYRTQDDTFTLEVAESGAGRRISMTQEEGNLLSVLFGAGADGAEIETGSRVSSGVLVLDQIAADPVLTDAEFTSIREGVLNLTVNGKSYKISVPRRSDGSGYTKSDLIKKLNEELKSQFGDERIQFDDSGNLVVSDGSQVMVRAGDLSGTSESALKAAAKAGNLGVAFFGANGGSNAATGDTTLDALGLTGFTGNDGADLAGSTKLSELADKTDNLVFENGRIILTSNGTGISAADEATMEKLFGVKTLDMGVAVGAQSNLVAGENALIKIDGLLTERSSNSFSVNGLNFDLRSITGSYTATSGELVDWNGQPLEPLQPGQYVEDGVLYNADGTVKARNVSYKTADGFPLTSGILCDRNTGEVLLFTGEAASVDVSRNTDQIVDGIKQFIDSYNKLISTLNDYLDEDPNYRDYAPLTSAQKKEMSEREIELWEEKAKEGLLRRDSTIETFLQSMRTALYSKPAGCEYALYDLGIETGDWESKGQLVLSEDGEARLRQILESDSAGVLQLFTDAEDGLAVRLNSIIDETAKTSSGSPGALVQLAGVKGKASETNNTLYNQLKDIDDKIKALKKTYEKEKNRYWNQFNAMEKMLANLSAQSSYLTQMMG